MDIEKEIKALKEKIESLEKKSKNLLFGSAYSSNGNTSSDYLIKTRGKVKIQIGNKFIDLIKDGSINVDSKFIYKAKEVGTKDGIYVLEDGSIILLVGGTQISLTGSSGTTYVSFMEEQNTTAEQKHTALKNIGLIYSSMEEFQQSGIQSGIVYIESTQKLYTIQNGSVSEYTVEFPNPYPKQFVIAKTDNSQGALVIKGSGIENSLKFDSLDIYVQDDQSYFNSKGDIYFKINDNDKILISDSQVVFSNKVISSTFQSKNANANSGFRLYVSGGESTLEIDNLIVRKKSNLSTEGNSSLYPTYWFKENNIISSIESQDEESSEDAYTIELVYTNKFQVGDYLYAYVPVSSDIEDNSEDDSEEESTSQGSGTSLVLVTFKVTSVNDTSIDVTLLESSEKDQELLNSIDITTVLSLQTIFLIGSETEISLLKRSQHSIDLINSTNSSDEQSIANITTRLGNIEELGKKGKDNNTEIDIKGTGFYSDNACFLIAQYTSNYELPANDSSTKFASTEWVTKATSGSMPIGSIIMFNGLASEIPEGWNICDGTNGTPNLIGKFIKASSTSGETGGSDEIQLTIDNLPSHTHTFTGNKLSTSEAGGHTHTFRGKYGLSDNADDRDVIVTGALTDRITTSENGAHSHTIDMSGSSLGNTGNGNPLKWEPIYYSLIYIMKIS